MLWTDSSYLLDLSIHLTNLVYKEAYYNHVVILNSEI